MTRLLPVSTCVLVLRVRVMVAATLAAAAAAVTPSIAAVPHTTVTAAGPEGGEVRFDGIGGLSGGGATSTFLLAYEEEARNAIMDWMYIRGYAATLSILKVEIGADDQTTDGTEASHMRTASEVNCSRGSEWALMKEAVKRNTDIVLYGYRGALQAGSASARKTRTVPQCDCGSRLRCNVG